MPSLGAQSGGGPSVSSGSRPKAVLGNKASSVASSSLSKWLKPQLQEGSRLQVSSGLTQGPVEAASSAVPVAKGPAGPAQRPRRQEVHPSSGAAAGEDAASSLYGDSGQERVTPGPLRSWSPPTRRKLAGKQKGFRGLGTLCRVPQQHGDAATTRAALDDLEDRLLEVASEAEEPEPGDKHSWPCPVCHAIIKGSSSPSLSTAKRWHLESRHPFFNRALVKQAKRAEVVQTSESLPMSQRMWTCPIQECNHGLPGLPYQDKKRAIREHCKRCHKKHTPRSLSFLWRTGRPQRKRGVSKQQTQKHQQVRESKYATHDVFTYRPGHWPKAQRGCAVYCKTCLAHLQHESKTVRHLTCSQRLQRLRTNAQVRTRKRVWWVRLRDESPQEMAEFLNASGLSQAAIDELVGLNDELTPRQLEWAKAKAAKAKAQKGPKPRAKVKAAAGAVGSRPSSKVTKAGAAKVRPKACSSGSKRAKL